MNHFRTFLFYAGFYGWTLFLAIVALPVVVMPKAVAYRVLILWARGTLLILKITCGLGYEVRGHAHISRSPAIYAIKHQSAWETIALLTLVPPLTAVLKKELLNLPIYGWYMRKLGMIPIDRSAGAGAMKKVIRRARVMLAANRSFMIAPEGTRMPPGETRRYQPGVVALYKNLDLPVVPVALNSGLFWPKGRWVKTPGTVIIEFLAPIGPGLGKDELLESLKSCIEPATRMLEAEGRGQPIPKPKP
jgi:1-acyl-sn-glycerol-3-phosphate acyltransferase